MGRLLAKDKVTGDITQGCVAQGRQAVCFLLAKVDNKRHTRRGKRCCPDQAKAACFDQATNAGVAFGNKTTLLVGNYGAIIRHQPSTQRYQCQPKRRLTRT